MSNASVQEKLRAGITAVKNGDRIQGRALLEAVLEVDERNETAWLWLSGAVETAEERQICLENVLAINPQNTLAQKGLAKLAQAAPEKAPDAGRVQVVRREYAPLSTASALLYPDDHIKTWEWRDPTAVQAQAETPGYQSSESYQDIWTKEAPMCGYCAQELALEDMRCPACKRNLVVKSFRYPNASSSLTVLWVLVLGVGQLFALQVLYNILAQHNLYTAVGSGLVAVLFVGLAAGIHFRQNWAHLTAIYVLAAVILGLLLRWALPADLEALGLASLDPAIQEFILPLTTGLGETLRGLILAGSVLALFYAVFKAGPDFDRVTARQVATLTKGPKTAADFNAAATQLARNGVWATAVLHWQNAAAKAPEHLAYQESLGRAYAQLGFFERSLDVLQGALKRSGSPERQAAIQQQIRAVQAKMEQQTQQAK
ncbi:MAG: hypothetical protein IPM53_21070 [Anaerolineaceae bacterium]|nr:hypothetical protein [Anaerolineaceae bacterium]